ncbi:MAG: glycosyltransferase family 4 protein [Leptolyngbyaceae cyanobacterium MO_188.B28]|nr:glycosyltransferase family 4 protein [Leptolyngbyaceae cyanobacterium MO_188.B28]
MDLVYTLTAYPPSVGGAQIHQHFLAQELKSRHSIQVISHWDTNRSDWLLGTTLKAPSKGRDYIRDDISIHRLGFSLWDKLKLGFCLPIYYPLMELALPIISNVLTPKLSSFTSKANLIHNIRIGREGLSYASLRLARRYDIPFVFTPAHHPRWVGWRYRIYIELYRQADAVIALTNTEKKTLVKLGVQEERIHVTGIGPVLANQSNGEAFKERSGICEPIILFLGQHYTYKGFQQVLKAAPFVWQRIPEANFVFIGPPVKRSEQYFSSVADPRIYRLGQVGLQEKTDALAACTLLCVPSSQESFGGVYTEAWMLGKPVIGCHIPAVAEVITEGVDGYLVAQQPEKVAERICYLLENPLKAQAMGEAGKQKVNSQYTWRQLATKTEAVYRSIVSG